MARYKLMENGVLDKENSIFIPNDYHNRHWQEFQEWLQEGNTPDPQYTLDELKQSKKAKIQSDYQNALQQPINYTVNNETHTFQADQHSQDVLTKVIVSAPSDFSTNWLDINNKPVKMTLDDLKGLAETILERGEQLFKKKILLKQQIEQATTKEELEKISWS